jgi:hypothetical protein
MRTSPPEYIIETHSDGQWCIIYDPPTGGEYYCFRINCMKSLDAIQNEIRIRLNAAYNQWLKENDL